MTLQIKWFEDICARKGRTLLAPLEVTGQCDRWLGTMRQRASLRTIINPCDKFSVSNEVAPSADLIQARFPDMAIFGFLDIAMICDFFDAKSVQLVLKSVDFSPVETSAEAFREAGRDAAQKFLASMRSVKRLPKH